MSQTGSSGTGAADARGGKYCPRCGAMAARDQTVCAHCAHQFRSGAVSAAAPRVAPTRPPDDLHRTQQFTLPPLPRTPPPAAVAETPALPVQNAKSPWPLALAGLAALLLLGCFVWKRAVPPPRPPTPAGAWTTTLRGTGANAQAADLKFVFADGGGGTYALGTTPPAPLRWTQTGSTLFLTLTPPTPPEAQYLTLGTVFNNRPWIWKRDPTRRTLTLGTLTFTQIFRETP